MKIAVLMDAPLRATLLSEKTMARLAEWGEVAVNETDKSEKETVKQIIAGADIAITSWGVPQLDKEILDCAPNLRFVAHAAGSVKGIVSDELYARGIRVVSSARILSYGVSETALGLTICACKNVFAFNEEIHNGGWVEDYSVITELVVELMFDITVGVVGCGFAGSHYIELLQAFGVNVLAYDPLLDEAAIAAMGAKKADLDTLLAESDVVSLHAPALDSTRHMINGRALSLMKDRAILINTARGDLVDNEALRQALLEGRIAGAGLDTLSPEPVPAGHPLTALPPEVHRKVVLAPHLGGITEASFRRAHAHMWRNVEHLAAGERPDNIVNGL